MSKYLIFCTNIKKNEIKCRQYALLIDDDIWHPEQRHWNSQHRHSTKVRRIPSEELIFPPLRGEKTGSSSRTEASRAEPGGGHGPTM